MLTINWSNCTINPSTGFSPFFLLYGRVPVLPADRVMNVPTLGFQSNEQYLINLDQNLVRAREIARACMKNAIL
jgi:hypothetical protein